MKNARISTEDVHHVARLARLDVSDEETERFAQQLNTILTYMDKLNELDTSKVEPMSHAIQLSEGTHQRLGDEFAPVGSEISSIIG